MLMYVLIYKIHKYVIRQYTCKSNVCDKCLLNLNDECKRHCQAFHLRLFLVYIFMHGKSVSGHRHSSILRLHFIFPVFVVFGKFPRQEENLEPELSALRHLR